MNDILKDIALQVARMGAPVLGGFIGGPIGAVAGKAIETLATSLGTKPEPEAIKEALAKPEAAAVVLAVETSPEKMAALVALSQEETKRLTAELADVQDARKSQAALQESGSAIAWSPVIVSALIYVIWGGLMYAVISKPLSFSEAQWQIVNIAFGTASGLAVQVANYWLGSSNGSRSKDATLGAVMRGLSTK